MAKDYKPRQPSRSGKGGSLLLGMFIGFVIGLATAAGIAVFMLKTPIPFVEKPKPTERQAPAAQNLKDAANAAQKDDGKPRFDFYRILPGQEEPVSNEQLKQAAAREKAGKAESEAREIYLLQAGSFQSPADADNLKARLALLGLEANVEPTTLPEKGVMYRVRLGPYNKIDEINKIRSQLAQNGVEPSLIRVRDAKQ
jgi:cell division protein FtsN